MPTLRIVLGWLSQSITAVNLLDGVAHLTLLWIALAAAVTIHTARQHLPFALTWWSFTFPVGTAVIRTSALALHSGSTVLALPHE